MSVLSTLALLISAAVRPKLKAKLKPAPDRQARILELELEADLAAARRETEGRDLVEALPKSERRRVGDLAFPAPAGAPLAYELCNCVPSRSDMWAHSRRV